mgnify:CR=1 FL=1
MMEGDVGTSPKKPGNPGAISEWVFQSLCTAFSSFIKINQLNAREVENDRKNLKARVLRVMEKEQYVTGKLLDRILDETAIDLLSNVSENVEDRRVRWTTYTNLKSWFNNWEHDLEELGFGKILLLFIYFNTIRLHSTIPIHYQTNHVTFVR